MNMTPGTGGHARTIPGGMDTVNDALDVPMSDDELLAEMTLLVALIVAANTTPRCLSAREIDDALGLGQGPATPHDQ